MNIRVVGLNRAVIPYPMRIISYVHPPNGMRFVLCLFRAPLRLGSTSLGFSFYHRTLPTFVMAGLMDILLALVKVLCGGSTTQEQPPSVSEYPKPHAERPPHQQATTARPEHHRQVSVVPYMNAFG